VATQIEKSTIGSFKCSLYLWTNTADAQKIIKKNRQSSTHAYTMQYKRENLVACQVWSKVKLFHMLFGGYLNHVRQALSALLKIKHVLYYNAMHGSTQAYFLVMLLRSSTLSSFLNRQNIASSSGFVKISTNWSSILTPSSDILFLATWSLRKWWWTSMC